MESENNILERVVGITLSGRFFSRYYPISFYFSGIDDVYFSMFKSPKILYLIIIFSEPKQGMSNKRLVTGY